MNDTKIYKDISYLDTGTGPVLLMGHSYLWDCHMWEPVLNFLRPFFRCIVPDLWGHGQSQVAAKLTLNEMAQRYQEFMNDLKIEHYAIAGLSIGGMWGSILAQIDRTKVTKLIIMNSSLMPEPEDKKLLYRQLLSQVESLGYFPEEIINHIAPGFFSPHVSDKIIEDFKGKLRQVPSVNIPCIVSIGRSLFERQELSNDISQTALIIAGSMDSYRSIAESQVIATNCGSQLKIVDAGHISVVEKAEEISTELINFLNS